MRHEEDARARRVGEEVREAGRDAGAEELCGELVDVAALDERVRRVDEGAGLRGEPGRQRRTELQLGRERSEAVHLTV